MIRADDEPSLARAIDRVSRLLRTTDIAIEREAAHEHLLIETFIPGTGVRRRRCAHRWRVPGIRDLRQARSTGRTILRGDDLRHALACSGRQRRRRSSTRWQSPLRALGLRHGPVHAECRVNDRGIYVLEVAARPIGGLCSKAIRFAAPDQTLATLEEVLLRHALGETITPTFRLEDATGVMMIPIPRRGVYRGVTGVEKARRRCRYRRRDDHGEA